MLVYSFNWQLMTNWNPKGSTPRMQWKSTCMISEINCTEHSRSSLLMRWVWSYCWGGCGISAELGVVSMLW